jgi:hypothetical protein
VLDELLALLVGYLVAVPIDAIGHVRPSDLDLPERDRRRTSGNQPLGARPCGFAGLPGVDLLQQG